MAESTAGGNLPVTAALSRLSLFWSGGVDVPPVDAAAVLLMADGRVASGSDVIYRDQPRHVSGSVTHAGKSISTLPGGTCFDVVDANLATVPPTIERIALVALAGGGLGRVPDLRVVLADLASGTVLAEQRLVPGDGTALVAGTLSRRGGTWEFRTGDQAHPGGPAGLARDLGLAPDWFSPLLAGAAPAPDAAAAPPPSFATALPAVPAPPPALPVPMPARRRAPRDGPPTGLVRDQRVLLANAAGGPVNRVTVDLAWEPAPGRRASDLEPVVLGFDATGIPLGFVSPARPDGFAGAAHYAGEAVGEGAVAAGTRIRLDLLELPPSLTALVLALTSAAPETLAELRRAACYVSDDVGHRLVGFETGQLPATTALLMAVVRRADDDRWQMQALGRPVEEDLVAAAARAAASSDQQRGTGS
jgi:stress response protein SCP2